MIEWNINVRVNQQGYPLRQSFPYHLFTNDLDKHLSNVHTFEEHLRTISMIFPSISFLYFEFPKSIGTVVDGLKKAKVSGLELYSISLHSSELFVGDSSYLFIVTVIDTYFKPRRSIYLHSQTKTTNFLYLLQNAGLAKITISCHRLALLVSLTSLKFCSLQIVAPLHAFTA